MNILLINPPYPYGGKKMIYLPASLIMLASKVINSSSGHQVKLLDLNVEKDESLFLWADLLCVSLVGLPHNSFAKHLIEKARKLNKKICIGGHGVENLSRDDIMRIFPDVIVEEDFWNYTGVDKKLEVSMVAGMKILDQHILAQYLKNEMPLVIGDHCIYQCDFCAARKGKLATVRSLDLVKEELQWLCEKAEVFSYRSLNFYATPLDFFQTRPQDILLMMKEFNENSAVSVNFHCLATIHFTELAIRKIKNLSELCKKAGLRAIGLGEDGDDDIWLKQNKKHNDRQRLLKCLQWGKDNGIGFQVLQVTGFPQQTVISSIKSLFRGFFYCLTYRVMLRPYMAKVTTPLLKDWDWEKSFKYAEEWKAFDYSSLATSLSHPNVSWFKRMVYNFCFLLSCFVVPFITQTVFPHPPVFPEWKNGINGRFYKFLNSLTGFEM